MTTPKDFIAANKHIVVCMILHNFLLVSNDICDEFDDDINENEILVDNVRNVSATNLRAIVQNYLLDWYQTNIMM